jgi:virginiamycin B lyase
VLVASAAAAALAASAASAGGGGHAFEVREYAVPDGSDPHDVAPARNGGVWYTEQAGGALGWLDPKTGRSRHVSLGDGSAPHGVIVGPDGAPWIDDGG